MTTTAGIQPFSKRFEAIVFDWDGTAVIDRRSHATGVRRRIEALTSAGMDVAVVSGTHVGNIDGQLNARPTGPGRLFFCLNRGSEVFRVQHAGPQLVFRREASIEEQASLDRAAQLTVDWLETRGLVARIVSARLNRRKIDLIPTAAWADPSKADIARLLRAVSRRLRRAGISSLAEVVAFACKASLESGLSDPRVTTDAKHIEIGLTDKSDSMRWVLTDLWARGIGPGLVLVAGDEFGPLGGVLGSDAHLLDAYQGRLMALSVGVEPSGVPRGVIGLGGGPDRFLKVLDEQFHLRERHTVPRVDIDPLWSIVLAPPPPGNERVQESLLALSDGRFGVRGDLEDGGGGATGMVLPSGVFGRSSDGLAQLLPGPSFTWLGEDCAAAPCTRVLDLHTGVLFREPVPGEEGLRTMRFASISCPGVFAFRAEQAGKPKWSQLQPLAAPRSSGLGSLEPPLSFRAGSESGLDWAMTANGTASVVALAREEARSEGGFTNLDRLVAYEGSSGRQRPLRRLRHKLDSIGQSGFDELLRDQRTTWAARWEDADIAITGDDEAQLAVRFALFHLLSCAAPTGEAAVGARGTTGLAYAGHVFWDAEVFVAPVLAATLPGAARAMLTYRVNRLTAAREAAASRGFSGARFPWESAGTGEDVTPRSATDLQGEPVAIRTGESEEHINADIAWVLEHYRNWTGDEGFTSGPAASLVIETARYWASRINVERGAGTHIRGVIGPDEYHELVDDDVFTNVMVRWHLRFAASLAGVSRSERSRWRQLAARLSDGFDPSTGCHEQFAGYFDLEPLLINEFARPPVAADVLLGRERVARSQIIKQADVLMAHHLVPQDMQAGSLPADLDFYGPRTAHGSSLSPAIHAAVLARAGRVDEALEMFKLACRIDLDDLTGTTAGGLHLAAMGGLWQAVVFGFAGVRPSPEALCIDPHIPPSWQSLEIHLRFRGRRVVLRIAEKSISLTADGPVPVQVASLPVVAISERRFARRGQGWSES